MPAEVRLDETICSSLYSACCNTSSAIKDTLKSQDSDGEQLHKLLKNIITGLSILIGFTWEHTFDGCVEARSPKLWKCRCTTTAGNVLPVVGQAAGQAHHDTHHCGHCGSRMEKIHTGQSCSLALKQPGPGCLRHLHERCCRSTCRKCSMKEREPRPRSRICVQRQAYRVL